MDPNTNLGYLMHHLSFTLDRNSDQILKKRLGIGFSQFKILTALRWQPAFQQRQIAEYLGQSEASISRQIRLLKKAGLIQTQVSRSNRREHMTTFTTKGDRLAEKATEVLNSYHRPMFERLSSRQQEKLREALIVIHDFVCKH